MITDKQHFVANIATKIVSVKLNQNISDALLSARKTTAKSISFHPY